MYDPNNVMHLLVFFFSLSSYLFLCGSLSCRPAAVDRVPGSGQLDLTMSSIIPQLSTHSNGEDSDKALVLALLGLSKIYIAVLSTPVKEFKLSLEKLS